jgi:hypothetical protein
MAAVEQADGGGWQGSQMAMAIGRVVQASSHWRRHYSTASLTVKERSFLAFAGATFV